MPNPFPIPRFRKHAEQNFGKKLLTDEDRKYVVGVIGTMLLTYVDSVSTKTCTLAAESLVRKYPFLKESVGSCFELHMLHAFLNINDD